jgi:hypothetical protein
MSNNKCEAGTTNCSGRLVLDESIQKSHCNKCGVEIEDEESSSIQILNSLVADDPRSQLGSKISTKDVSGKKRKLKTNLSSALLEYKNKQDTDIQNLNRMVQSLLIGKIPGFNSLVENETKSFYLFALKRFQLKGMKSPNSKNLLAVSAYHTLKKYERPLSLVHICEVIISGERKLTENELNQIRDKKIKNRPKLFQVQENGTHEPSQTLEMKRSADRLYNKLKDPNIEIIMEVIPSNPLNIVRNNINEVANGPKIDAIYQRSQEYLKKMQDAQLTASKNPAGIAASLVYASMKQLGLPVKQSLIARIFGVSDLSVRKNSKELFSLLERSLA